jgi:hypothetical protein
MRQGELFEYGVPMLLAALVGAAAMYGAIYFGTIEVGPPEPEIDTDGPAYALGYDEGSTFEQETDPYAILEEQVHEWTEETNAQSVVQGEIEDMYPTLVYSIRLDNGYCAVYMALLIDGEVLGDVLTPPFPC